jgi:uncharacterized protein YbjQ (UPF0145 family)
MNTSLKAAALALPIALALCAGNAAARDTTHYLSIKDAIQQGKAEGKLSDDIQLYFGDQPHASVKTMLTKGISTNKKTNAANKTDEHACQIAMLSALIQMQQTARNQGGNAVVNIESFYKKKAYRNNDLYECHAGAILAGVVLRGDIVQLNH